MWRFIAVLVINLSLFLGLWIYTGQEKPVVQSTLQKADAVDTFDLVFTSSVRLEADPFAMDIDEQAAGLTLKLADQVFLKIDDKLVPGEPIVLKAVTGIKVGKNAFLIEATIPEEQVNASHAFRLSILQNGRVIADESKWTSPGDGNLVEEVVLEVREQADVGHDHDH